MWHKLTNKCQRCQQIYSDSERKISPFSSTIFASFGPRSIISLLPVFFLTINLNFSGNYVVFRANEYSLHYSEHLITDGQKISNNDVIDIHQATNNANNTTTNK